MTSSDPNIERQKIIREAEEAGRAEQRREAARQKMRERQMRKGISADYLEDNEDDGYSLNAIKVLRNYFRNFSKISFLATVWTDPGAWLLVRRRNHQSSWIFWRRWRLELGRWFGQRVAEAVAPRQPGLGRLGDEEAATTATNFRFWRTIRRFRRCCFGKIRLRLVFFLYCHYTELRKFV